MCDRYNTRDTSESKKTRKETANPENRLHFFGIRYLEIIIADQIQQVGTENNKEKVGRKREWKTTKEEKIIINHNPHTKRALSVFLVFLSYYSIK